MDFLRKANVREVVRVTHEESGAWVELKAEVTKGQFNNLAMNAPSDSADLNDVMPYLEQVFAVFVSDWSLTDENNNRVKPSIEAYRALTTEAGLWIDNVLGEHFRTINGRSVSDAEGKPTD